MTRATPPLFLEQMHAGERPRASLSPVDDARLSALVADDAQFHARVDASAMLARIHATSASLSRPAPRRSPSWVLAPALAAAALIVVVMPGASSDERLKGAHPALLVSRLEQGHATTLTSGGPARAGDVLQLRTVAAGQGHGVVLSLDGAGGVTLHFPATGDDTTLPTGTQPLPFSFELDDAPGFERFVFITSSSPLSVAQLEHDAHAVAARADARTAQIPLPPGAEMVEFVVDKTDRSP